MKYMMWVQLLTVSVLLIFFFVIPYRSAAKETNSVAVNFLKIYGTQIENRLEKIGTQMSMILGEEEDFLLLGSEEEATRFYAANRLSEYMKDIMVLEQSVDMFVAAQADYGIRLEANNGEVHLKDKEAVRNRILEMAEQGLQSGQWRFGDIGGKEYFYRVLGRDSRALAGVVSVKSLLNTLPDVRFNHSSFVLADAEGRIRGYAGSGLFEEKIGIPISNLDGSGKFRNEITLGDGKMTLYSYVSRSEAFKYLHGNAGIMFLIIVLLFMFDFYFMSVEEKQLILPMGEMVEDMKKMEAGDYEHRVSEDSGTREFAMLARTFNKLMDEIIHLKIQFYEKKLALGEAEQRYIRLQIRPHFFLNAMTTIMSLSAKGKNAEIEIYINALSKNIRYMFSSGLHTVTVKEELRHVENYFEMQELRYPECLFYYISLPEELEEWRIPQMLIHTLVENEYKYAVSQEGALMVLIKVSTEVHDGEEMLLLEVEDDGKGYPEEVLAYMNRDSTLHRQDGTRVGLWSIKRLLELMYDRKDLIELSNVQPHGAMNRIYIPLQPVNERNKSCLDEQGIE